MRPHFLALVSALALILLAASLATAQPLRDDLPPPPGGDAPRDAGFLGLVADDVEPPGKGVEVISVHPAGPAETAGIRKGDVIAAIDGKIVASLDEVAAAIEGVPVGKKLKIEVIRAKRHVVYTVTATRRPTESRKLTDPEPALELPSRTLPPTASPPKPDLGDRASLGVRLLPLTDEIRRKYGITALRGAVIEGIREGSPADKFGLPLGGVIFSFDGRRIDAPDEVVAALRGARPGDEVEIGYYQGDRMFRKLVRLSPAVPAVPADSPLGAPSPTTGAPGLADRPAVKKIEGLLDRLLPPAGGVAPGAAPATDLVLPKPAEDRTEIVELRSEIELLKAEIARLNRKVTELEKRLPE